MILLLLACGTPTPGDTAPTGDDTVDQRLDFADVTAPPSGGEQWYGPEAVLQPGEELQYCMFGTYTGPDVGIATYESFQSEIGHHLILLGTTASELDYPDGTVVDCTKTNQMMTSFEPLINAEPTGAGTSFIELPAGMAVKLDEGQRWVVQAHWLNTTPDPVIVRDVLNMGFVPEESVTTWAAAFALTQVDLSLPPQSPSDLTFDCSFPEEYTLLYLTGHMHEYGERFRFELGDGTTMETLYEIPEWDPVYRDAPPLQRFEDGERVFAAGSTLRTTCEWYNDTDEAIEFPNEMCATYGMLYPSTNPVVCSD
ncbi:MAG: hypothetical protein ACK4YP_00130 [Myxococcota bacterium]